MNRRQESFFRKKLLIHPQFQLTLMGLNWLVITLVFGALRIQSARVLSDLTPLASLSKISGAYSDYYLNYQADRFNTSLLLLYGVAMVASGALTLLASYRFAGPLVRMKSYFRSLSEPQNPVTQLSFRSGDFFSDLPPLVNSAVKRLQGAEVSEIQGSFKKVS
jgi:hypothetical protein